MSASSGERLRAIVCDRTGGRSADEYLSSDWDRIASEYDKARAADLPADVFAIVAEAEMVADRLPYVFAKSMTILCRIVREQTARIRTLEDDICIVSCGRCSRAIVGIDQGLAACPWCERNALHERLAGLEAVASDMVLAYKDWADGGSQSKLCDAGDALSKLLEEPSK